MIYKIVMVINVWAGLLNLICGIKEKNFYQVMCGILFLMLAFSIFIQNFAINKRDKIIKRQEKTIKEILKLGEYNNG